MTEPRSGGKVDASKRAGDLDDEVELPPNAASLIESMRDLGYSLETAVADIIDNSLTARATKVEIQTHDASTQFRLGIIDDGEGMDRKQLLAAMVPGSRSPLEERAKGDLGRFGLGLKTASFSQCRQLTVVSRKSGLTTAATWDLDLVQSRGMWIVRLHDDLSRIPWLDRLGEHGTLVLWEQMDRVEKGTPQVGSPARAQELNERLRQLSEHLELVFHRFLSGDKRNKKIRITLNDRDLEPFDPFNSAHPATQFLPTETISISGNAVVVQPVVLPHFSKVDRSEWERYGGTSGYQRTQGFYLYRHRRLIVYGTWMGLMRQLPISQLARVQIDIDNTTDADWKIDVKKASAQLPSSVRARLREIIGSIDMQSRKPFSARGVITIDRNRLPTWNRHQSQGAITYRINNDHPLIGSLRDGLDPGQRKKLAQILEFVAAALPIDALYSDLGSDAEKVKAGGLDGDTLAVGLAESLKRLRAGGLADDEIRGFFLNVEPYNSNLERTKEILRELMPGMEEK